MAEVMAEETFFFENFPKMRLGRLGLTRPNPKPGFRIKMGWAAHNTRTPELQREQHAPATTAPRTSVRSHPKLTTAPCTTHASNDGDGVGNDYRLQRHLVLFFFCSVFFFFSVWHSFLIFGSAFFFSFLFSPLLLITTKRIMLGLEKMIRTSTFTLHFALCFYPFVILNSWMSLFGVGYCVNSWNFFSFLIVFSYCF